MNQLTPNHEICSIFFDRSNCTNLNTGNNQFQFNFPKQISTTEKTRISVSNFSVPYSWFNITDKIGNNKLGYTWTNAGITTEFNFTIDDGNYSLLDLNKFLQFQMIKNNHYLINTDGNYVYYLELGYNVTRYRIQVNSYQPPHTLPVGWTNPGVAIVFNAAYQNIPTLKFTASTRLGERQAQDLLLFFGLNTPVAFPVYLPFGIVAAPNGTKRGSSSPAPGNNVVALPDLSLQMIMDNPPEQDTVHSINLACYGVDNPLRTSGGQISSFVITTQNINVSFGNNIVNSNFLSQWIPMCANQVFSSLVFTLTDQSGNPLILVDPDINIELLLTNVRY